MAAIGDMLDFGNAIGVALKFYKKHSHETLIVVTGDKDTLDGQAKGSIDPKTGKFQRLLRRWIGFQ
jgi:alkaline phosphatase